LSGNPDIQPTWPLLLKTEKVVEILIFFLLNYWANWIQALLKYSVGDPLSKFCLVVPYSGQDGRCYYLLTIPCTLSRMQGFTYLIKSYKTNMFRLFQWNTVRRRI
jgi:hypothetical protein